VAAAGGGGLCAAHAVHAHDVSRAAHVRILAHTDLGAVLHKPVDWLGWVKLLPLPAVLPWWWLWLLLLLLLAVARTAPTPAAAHSFPFPFFLSRPWKHTPLIKLQLRGHARAIMTACVGVVAFLACCVVCALSGSPVSLDLVRDNRAFSTSVDVIDAPAAGDGGSFWGTLLGQCSAFGCPEASCKRTLVLAREHAPFSLRARNWRFAKNISWATTATSLQCTAVLVNGGAIVVEKTSQDMCDVGSVRFGLDLALPDGGALHNIYSYRCAASTRVQYSVATDGDHVAIEGNNKETGFFVLARDAKSGLWKRVGQTFNYDQWATFSLAEGGRLILINGQPFELNTSSSLWQSGGALPPLHDNSDSFVLVNETMLIQSQPGYSQDTGYAG
jgi:hypothetical protein